MIVRIGPAGWAGILALASSAACAQQQEAGTASAATFEAPEPVAAEAPQAPGDEEDTGLGVGSKAPEFTLKDQSGEERSLDGFIGQGKKTALVFYRSADW